MRKQLCYETAEPATPIDGLTTPAFNRVTSARFAGAIDDYNAMHLDDRVAEAAGKASVYAPSSLVISYLGRMVQGAFGGTSLRRFGVRVLKLLWPGDVLTCRGSVIDKREEDGEYLVDVDIWAENQRGETVAKGRVLAVVPANAETPLSEASAAHGLVYPVQIPNEA